MTDFNPYEVLKLDKTATGREIKQAYRELAKKHHPDKHSNDAPEEKKLHESLFKQINRAYDCLSDLEKKARYDEYGVCEEHEMREGKEDSGSVVSAAQHRAARRRQEQEQEFAVAKAKRFGTLHKEIVKMNPPWMATYEAIRSDRRDAYDEYIKAKRASVGAESLKSSCQVDPGENFSYMDEYGQLYDCDKVHIDKYDSDIKKAEEAAHQALWNFSVAHNRMRTIEKDAELPKRLRLAFTSLNWNKGKMTGKLGVGGDTIEGMKAPADFMDAMKNTAGIRHMQGGRRKKTRKKRRRKNKRKTKRRKKTRRRKKRRKKRRTKRR